jgi:ribonuclease J
MRDNEELMNNLRQELRRAVQQRFKRIDLDRFKAELKDHITHFLFEQTQRSPIVIPVVNVIGGGTNPKGETKTTPTDKPTQSPEDIAQEQERRFKEMRERLLTQDARID